MDIISVNNLSFKYHDGKVVFDSASLKLADKEKLAVWGPNGCGKTTFLKLLTGLLKKDGGEILLAGNPVETENDYRNLRMKCGFVLQNPDDQLFFPEVIDDVSFGPLNQGLTPEEALAVSNETLEQLGIKDLDHAISDELSGGQKKLVSLATVLSMKPSVLLLDEPTNGLDVESRLHLMDVINSLDVSMILVSHDSDLLVKTCSRYVTIKNGKFQEIASPVAI